MKVATLTEEQANSMYAVLMETPAKFSLQPIEVLKSLKFAEQEVTPIEAEKVE